MRHKRVHQMPFNYIGNMIINKKTGVHRFRAVSICIDTGSQAK